MRNGKICSECGSTPCSDECSAITITESQIETIFEYWKDHDINANDATHITDDTYASESKDYFLKIYNKLFVE